MTEANHFPTLLAALCLPVQRTSAVRANDAKPLRGNLHVHCSPGEAIAPEAGARLPEELGP